MNAEDTLRQAVESCFSDWEGDFEINIKYEHTYNNRPYFMVSITHIHYGPEYWFAAGVKEDGCCAMEYGEDCWQEITKANLFAHMWFESVELKVEY